MFEDKNRVELVRALADSQLTELVENHECDLIPRIIKRTFGKLYHSIFGVYGSPYSSKILGTKITGDNKHPYIPTEREYQEAKQELERRVS